VFGFRIQGGYLLRCFLFVMLTISSVLAQANGQRPHILGLAHVAFRVGDIARTGSFYKSRLGFVEPFSVRDANEKATIAVVKVNDEQYVELLQGNDQNRGQLDHFALYTDDLTAMRRYLMAERVPIVIDIHQGRVGNPFLTILDPDDHHIEILQYASNSMTARTHGDFMPPNRVSNHMTHVGIDLNSSGSAMKFYRDILGFREFARDGGSQAQWIDLQVPDGSDYLELLPFTGAMSPDNARARNHIGLASSDVRKTVASLQNGGKTELATSFVTLTNGDGLPTRAYISDPDGARIEIMEPMSSRTASAGRQTSVR
jgi:catechol 2,3-dioxygenase-like lactoylglutathione lyase family enzyme